MGQNIFSEVQSIASLFEIFGFSFLNCKYLTLIWMFMAIVRISIRAIKFEDITVTFHPTSPSKPTIIQTEKKQLKSGINTHIKLLKTNQSVQTMKQYFGLQVECFGLYFTQSLQQYVLFYRLYLVALNLLLTLD